MQGETCAALKAPLCPECEAAGRLPTYAAVGVSVSLLSADALGRVDAHLTQVSVAFPIKGDKPQGIGIVFEATELLLLPQAGLPVPVNASMLRT